MYDLAKTARDDMKAKAKRMASGDPHQKVDASSWTPCAPLNADEQTGKKPTMRPARKHGGKVEGAQASKRADKAPRIKKDIGGSLAMLSPALAIANMIRGKKGDDDNDGPSAPGKKRGGRAGGGDVGETVPQTRFNFSPSMGSAISRTMGLKKGGSVSDGEIEGTRPKGGRMARKHGGRAKGKTDINIIINGGKGDAPPPAPPLPMTGAPPPGLGPPGAPPMPPPMPAGGPPMARKAGGRVKRAMGGPMNAPPAGMGLGAPSVGAAPPPAPAPAIAMPPSAAMSDQPSVMTGIPPMQARFPGDHLGKLRRMGVGPAPMMRNGGRTGYPLDAGSGSGEGRLEKRK